MPIIEVRNVSKEYRLGALSGAKHRIQALVAQLRGIEPPTRPLFHALNDVSFSVEPGEVVGIIGQNGAGKSTLLKILSRITVPTRGEIAVRAPVAPLIEVGAGLVGDLTGRENVYLNGAILGLKRKEVARRFDEIVSFAELEEFIDTPVKRYSSGMMVRLGFSIATALDAEILIVDEVLAVGDLAFQRKCFDRMEHMIRRQGKTVLLVSHNIRQVDRLCSRVLLLDRGQILSDGPPKEVCNLFYDRSNAKIASQAREGGSQHLTVTEDMAFLGVEVLSEDGRQTEQVECLQPMRVRVHIEVNRPLQGICWAIGTHTSDFLYLTFNDAVDEPRDFLPGTYSIELAVGAMTLLPGVYAIRFWMGTPAGKVSFSGENLAMFRVTSSDYRLNRLQERALTYLDGTWRVSRMSEASVQAQSGDGGAHGEMPHDRDPLAKPLRACGA